MYRQGPEGDSDGRETEEQAGATQLKRCILNIRLQVSQFYIWFKFALRCNAAMS